MDEGRVLVADRHLLSKTEPDAGHGAADAGAIPEDRGRLKDAGYVKNVVSHYRRAIDAGEGASAAARWARPRSRLSPILEEFQPRFHAILPAREAPGHRVGQTPKSTGVEVGVVTAVDGGVIQGAALRPGMAFHLDRRARPRPLSASMIV